MNNNVKDPGGLPPCFPGDEYTKNSAKVSGGGGLAEAGGDHPDRSYTYRDGFCIVVFILVVFVVVTCFAYYVSKSYAAKKAKTCCESKRLLIKAMSTNISDSLAKEMNTLLEMPSEAGLLERESDPLGDELKKLFPFVGDDDLVATVPRQTYRREMVFSIPVNATNVSDPLINELNSLFSSGMPIRMQLLLNKTLMSIKGGLDELFKVFQNATTVN